MSRVFDSAVGVCLLVAWMIATSWVIIEQGAKILVLQERVHLMETGQKNEYFGDK